MSTKIPNIFYTCANIIPHSRHRPKKTSSEFFWSLCGHQYAESFVHPSRRISEIWWTALQKPRWMNTKKTPGKNQRRKKRRKYLPTPHLPTTDPSVAGTLHHAIIAPKTTAIETVRSSNLSDEISIRKTGEARRSGRPSSQPPIKNPGNKCYQRHPTSALESPSTNGGKGSSCLHGFLLFRQFCHHPMLDLRPEDPSSI